MRFERLQSDFDKMLEYIGCENTPLKHMEKREHKPYIKMYTETSMGLVKDKFGEDISRFDYRF